MAETTGKPTFIWQAVLITAPVLILLLVGLSSLQQDKLLARREAADQARRLADELLAAGTASLASPVESRECAAPVIQLDPSGQLLSPPPIARLSPKPLLPETLTPEQARTWRTARQIEGEGSDPVAAIAAHTRLVALQPPPEFAAIATYSLGLLYAAQGDIPSAVGHFTRLMETQPGAATESGLPLWPLACWKLLELQTNLPPGQRLERLQSLCSNLVYHPTPVTAALLRDAARYATDSASAAALQQWTELWRRHGQVRGLYGAAKSHFTSAMAAEAPAFWFSSGKAETGASRGTTKSAPSQESQAGPWWLAVRCQEKPGGWFRCWPEAEAAAELKRVISRIASHQSYFGIEVRVGGRAVVWPEEAPGKSDKSSTGAAAELLAVGRRAGRGAEWFEANVYLARPALLYAHQRTRRLWFGGLIGSSAVAALIGLLASWRAFQRQQRLSEMKSDFVSSVSHELRTPIASVQLLVDGLESGRVSELWKQQEYLRLIRQECRRLSAMIENILDVSRIEQGRKEFQFEPADPVTLVEQTAKIIEPCAAKRKVVLSVAIPGRESWTERPLPWLDRGSIEQALLNLVDNAIKHSPEGQTVTIGLEWAEDQVEKAAGQKRPQLREQAVTSHPRAMLLIWVEDHGPGIPAEEHEKIFERFYRRGSELRRETQGAGIGLSIVKHVVEAHGGRVLVRSAIGQGSRFTMELPVNSQPPDYSHET